MNINSSGVKVRLGRDCSWELMGLAEFMGVRLEIYSLI